VAVNPQVSFVPTEQDLQFYQGAPVVMSFAVLDGNGNPVNMTGGTILATIRATQSRTGTLIATFTVTWVNQAMGQFTLSLTSAQTDAFTFSGQVFYDVFFQDNNTPQNDYPLVWGIVSLQNDVSF
jgi:hypothetical protein